MLLLILAVACLLGFIGYQHGYTESLAEGRNPISYPKTRLREPPAMDRDAGSRRSAKLTIEEKTRRLRLLADRMRSAGAITESWEIIRDLGERDIGELLDQLDPQNNDSEITTDENLQIALLYFRWAQVDPVAALESADTRNDEAYASESFASWVKQDPVAARRWATTSGKFKDSRILVDQMALSLTDLPPAEALTKASSYGDKTREATLKLICKNQADTPAGREIFLSGLSSGDLSETEKPAAMKAFFTTWAAHDALAALDKLAALPLKPEQQTESRQLILRTWGRNDPEAALTWMIGKSDSLPDARQLNCFRYWNQGAPLRASAWLAGQSPEIRQKFKRTP